MATGGADLLRAVSERLLACGICLEEFHSQTRLPRLLPCSHSFCEPCLRQMMQKNKVRCPMCRRVQQADKEFPVDTTRVTLLDLHQAARDAQTVQSPVSPGEGSCSEHGKTLELYCRACQLTICSSCLLKRHKDHHVCELDEVVQEKRDGVRELCRELDQVIPVCRAKAQESDLNLKTMETNLRRAERQMEALFSEAVSSLLDRQSQVLQELRAQAKADRLVMQEQVATFRSLLSAAATTSEHGQRMTTESSPISTLASDGDIEKVIGELKKQVTTPVLPPPKYRVERSMLEDLLDLVKDMGKIYSPILKGAGRILQNLPVAFPAIRLNAARSGPDCSVDAGGTTLRNRPGPPRDSQESAQVFRFSGTCSTATTSQKTCYWQVTCSVDPQPEVIEKRLLCEAALVPQDMIDDSSQWEDWTGVCVSTVYLYVKDGSLMAGVGHNNRQISATELALYTAKSAVTCTLGFLLDVSSQHVYVIDADASRVLGEHQVELSQPLWPVFRTETKELTGADVCLTFESGQQMKLTTELFNLILSLMEEQSSEEEESGGED